MTTIRDLLTAALRKISVISAGETLQENEGQDALEALQLLVDGFSTEQLLIPVTSVVTHTLVTGQSDYTIGVYPSPQPDPLPTNHIETAKPMEYLSAFLRDNAATDYAIRFSPYSQYTAVGQKLLSSRPSHLYIQDGWPLDTLRFLSVPDDSDTLHITCRLPLDQLLNTSSLNTVIDLPPGYKRMLTYNLAVELAPEYEMPVSSAVAHIAQHSKQRIKSNNLQVGKLTSDVPDSAYNGRVYYDINSGPVS